jgi:hypothetical protein
MIGTSKTEGRPADKRLVQGSKRSAMTQSKATLQPLATWMSTKYALRLASLSAIQRRAVDAVKTGKVWLSSELAGELSTLRYPICFMDFETMFPALPKFGGMRPYDHIPFQWSVHRQERSNAPLEHFEFLAEGISDPRAPFIKSLCEAVKGAGSIVVYNQVFESSRLDDLAQWLPEYRSEISEIKQKLWDLLDTLRQNVYHPAFEGSFSLKKVSRALLRDLSYQGLLVADGVQAGLAWMKFSDPNTAVEDKERLKRALLDYCGLDTLVLAKLVGVLKESVGIVD